MKILVLAPQPFYQDRGTPIAVKLLAEVLAKEGHTVTILAFHEGRSITIPGVKILRTPALPGLKNIKPGPSWKKYVCDVLMGGSCLRLLRKERFDVIHAVEESAFFAIGLRALFGVPFVYDMDSSLADQMVENYASLRFLSIPLRFFERTAVRTSSGVIAVCQYLEGVARAADPRKPILRLEDITLLSDVGAASALSGEAPRVDGPVIMYVGNLEKHQGIDLLLESFRTVAREDATAHLGIVGGSPAGIQHYREKATEIGIATRTTFWGPRPITELGAVLNHATILVSPRTRGKNTPMKIYSYLDSGKPVVATRLQTHTQVLDDQVAVLVDPEPEAMAAGILQLLRAPQDCAALAQRAKQRVAENYSYEAFERKIGAFYRSLEQQLQGGPVRRVKEKERSGL